MRYHTFAYVLIFLMERYFQQIFHDNISHNNSLRNVQNLCWSRISAVGKIEEAKKGEKCFSSSHNMGKGWADRYSIRRQQV